MKKVLLILSLVVSMVMSVQAAIAQDLNKISILERKIDSLYLLIDSLVVENNIYLEEILIHQSLRNRYKMYPTENTYNLLELDTQTGIVKQVQWGLDDTYEGWWYINSKDLSYSDGYGPGTFELYATPNLYQFILLDKTDGRKWHIQWGIGDEKRWIRRIW